jgi:hypothetical protein
MDPTNPHRIRFEMKIPKLFGEETSVTSFKVKETQTSFNFGQAEKLPCNQG